VRSRIAERLPDVDLADVLIAVDAWTGLRALTYFSE
jgi:hypothetical protein